MEELIKITEQNGRQAVSARELHSFLKSKQDFSTWIKARIDKYGFVENQDFEVFHNFVEQVSGGKHLIEYALSVDCAKEISMVEGNEKGRQARKYFIECEKLAKNPAQNISRIELAKMIIQVEEEKERLQIENNKLRPRSEFVDVVFATDNLLTLSQAAKTLNLPFGRNKLCDMLREKGIFFKSSLEPKQTYIDKGYFRLKEVLTANQQIKFQTFATQKGLGFLAKTFDVITVPLNRTKFLNQ